MVRRIVFEELLRHIRELGLVYLTCGYCFTFYTGLHAASLIVKDDCVAIEATGLLVCFDYCDPAFPDNLKEVLSDIRQFGVWADNQCRLHVGKPPGSQ